MKVNLNEVTALAHRQIDLLRQVDEAEAALSALKAQLWKVQTEDLPNAMLEAGGLTRITLDSGEEISVKPDLTTRITEEHKPAAFAWLEQHGYDSIIKTEVTAAFGKGEMEKAQKLLLELSKKKLNVTLGRAVHPSTLKAFVSEQIRAAKPIPMDLFSVQPFNKAVIKEVKK